MEAKNHLGIYLSKDTATVVCLGPGGNNHNVLGCFSVSAQEQTEQKHQELATLITQGCAERELQFSEVAVALDCAMFMQHDVHSDFKDPKQIAQTVRFDTEEALATDVSEIANAFQITSSNEDGSALSVFTTERKTLSDVILSLQSHHIDPVTIEPDVSCLSRFISRNISGPEGSHPLFGVLSRRRGYFVVPVLSDSKGSWLMRTFLVGPTQTRTAQLAREVFVTTALLEDGEPIDCLKTFDSTGSVNYQQLSERLGFEASGIDFVKAVSTEPDALTDCADPVDFAIAYGAALAHLEKPQSMNFRSDFMPYQGKKQRMEKALKFASVSVTVLLLALGVYFQMPLMKTNEYRSRLRKKFAKEYKAVMPGRALPGQFVTAQKRLESELRRIRDVQSGRFGAAGEESMLSKLTLVLEAFNNCAASTNLKINEVSVTEKNIRIKGDTASMQKTLELRKSIEKSNLEISQDSITEKSGRSNFIITVIPKK